ncbi:MAG: response regulator transcription factor [Bacteroidota bacterium]
MQATILLVEDDPTLGYVLSEYLKLEGFTVQLAKTGKEGLKLLRKSVFDLCILDVMLPEMDGFRLAEAIEKEGHALPFLFLTAKSLKEDKLKGFNLGADDYLVKPVDEEELVARIKAVLRRAYQEEEKRLEPFEIGSYLFDYPNLQLQHQEEKRQLTEREGKLLRLLCEHQDRLLPRTKVLRTLWRQSDYFSRRSMDVFISRLRKYLAADQRIKITNVYGSGFIFSIEKSC